MLWFTTRLLIQKDDEIYTSASRALALVAAGDSIDEAEKICESVTRYVGGRCLPPQGCGHSGTHPEENKTHERNQGNIKNIKSFKHIFLSLFLFILDSNFFWIVILNKGFNKIF